MSKVVVSFLLTATLAVVLGLVSGQSVPTVSRTSVPVTRGNAHTPASVNSTVQPPMALSGEVDCGQYDSCGACIDHVECYYCYTDHSCHLYPVSKVLPVSECPLNEVRWWISCHVSFLAMVITAGVIVGVLLLVLCCCCYCCCCKRSRCCSRKKSGYTRMTGTDFDVTFDDRNIQLNLGDRRLPVPRANRTTSTSM